MSVESEEQPGAALESRLIGSARQPTALAVRRAITPIVEGLGLSLVGVELTREGRRPVLWVYIDREGGGVTIDDCAQASPEISATLDVADPLVEAYDLRISSPGLDRPMMSAADFVRYAGRPVVAQLSEPVEGRRRFTGLIGALVDDGEGVTLECSDGAHVVPLESIQKARLKYDPAPPAPKRKP